MATIETRTNDNGDKSYRVKVRLKGYPAQSATFDRLTDAKKWAAATESAIREGRHFKTAEAKKHAVSDMLTRYYSEILPHYNEKEQKERKSKLEWWRQVIGHCLLADVTPAAINEHKSKMTQSPATVDKYLKNLSHAFTIAVNDWGWLEDNPVKKVKSPKLPRGRVRFLDDAERERLLTACQQSSNDRLYLCVILALSTGMRQGCIIARTCTPKCIASAHLGASLAHPRLDGCASDGVLVFTLCFYLSVSASILP